MMAETETRRLAGHERRSNNQWRCAWSKFVTGIILAVVGALFALTESGLIVWPIAPQVDDFPPWIDFLIGGSLWAFGISGLIDCVDQNRSRRKVEQLQQYCPNDPWHEDNPRSNDGIHDESRQLLLLDMMMISGGALVLSLSLGMIWYDETPWGGQVFFGLLGIGAIVMVAVAISIPHWWKYGTSHLRLDGFPFVLGEPLNVWFSCQRGIAPCRNLEITLRCVEERLEKGVIGKELDLIVCYQIYADTMSLTGSCEFQTGRSECPISFVLPSGSHYAPNMSERPWRYWELEVKAEASGINFASVFLLPVYAA